MNYIKPDPTKQTSCKNCIFAIYEGTTQTGCQHNRIEKFGNDVIEAYDYDSEFFVINRKCNLFRHKSNETYDINQAREESCQTFDLLVDVNQIDNQYYELIAKQLNNIDFPKDKYKILFFHSSTNGRQEKEFVSKLYKSSDSSTISVYFDRAEFLDAFVCKSKNTFHVILDRYNIEGVGKFIKTIDCYINDELKKCIVCKDENKVAVANIACRLLYVDLYRNYDKAYKDIISESKKSNLLFEF